LTNNTLKQIHINNSAQWPVFGINVVSTSI